MKTFTVWIAALALAIAFSTSAYAQSSVQGYNDQAGQTQDEVAGASTGSGSGDDTGGSLPFTGLDIALLLGAGGVLMGVGVGMRHLTRGPESA